MLLSNFLKSATPPEEGSLRFLEVDVPSSDGVVPADDLSEVIRLQQLVTYASNESEVHVSWHEEIEERVFPRPTLFPICAVLLLLDNVRHTRVGAQQEGFHKSVTAARRKIYEYRMLTDLATPNQAALCADSRGYGRPFDLYAPDQPGRLRSREEYETLVERILLPLFKSPSGVNQAFERRSALATILYELFENTEVHGKKTVSGAPLAKNGIRGVLVRMASLRRVERKYGQQTKNVVDVSCLELSIFDTGVGFYSSLRKAAPTERTSIAEENGALHECLKRHFDPSSIPRSAEGHRGLGLYEVLRNLLLLEGWFEIRTGRLHVYRTFLKGDMRLQREPENSSRPNMPKEMLLDWTKRYSGDPTEHRPLIGSSIRILIPLE